MPDRRSSVNYGRGDASINLQHQRVMRIMKRSTGESTGRVTLSGGVACYRQGETPWALMRRADTCVGAAKRNGGNTPAANRGCHTTFN